jgi:hypothetical protein
VYKTGLDAWTHSAAVTRDRKQGHDPSLHGSASSSPELAAHRLDQTQHRCDPHDPNKDQANRRRAYVSKDLQLGAAGL